MTDIISLREIMIIDCVNENVNSQVCPPAPISGGVIVGVEIAFYFRVYLKAKGSQTQGRPFYHWSSNTTDGHSISQHGYLQLALHPFFGLDDTGTSANHLLHNE